MDVRICGFEEKYIEGAIDVWNQVVEDGMAFPQTEYLAYETGMAFFEEQSYTGVALDESDRVLGLYILHPNNIGRCGHICNASYAVRRDSRGMGVGETLVRHCLAMGKELGFRIMQFNAVVASNARALRLYEKLGFVRLGVIPGGFLNKDGVYEDIVPQYRLL